MLYRWLVRPVLFLLPAETAHRVTMALLELISKSAFLCGLLGRLFGSADPSLRVEALGLRFPSPIGLAAGLDKDGLAYEALAALGFGFVEIGTLTPLAQPGNDAPRLFRLRADRALLNRMGFNNRGAERASADLAMSGRRAIVGANIGKNKQTPLADAAADYVRAARSLAPYADYIAVNVSSPNTPGLRSLQSPAELEALLAAVQTAVREVEGERRVPVLLKVSPDLADGELDEIADLALRLGIAGIIATNSTVERGGLEIPRDELARLGDGGITGPPLRRRSLEILRRLRARAGRELVLISCGGIDTASDVWARLEAGATLVELYTALIYEGPGLVSRINAELVERLRSHGYKEIADVGRVGRADHAGASTEASV